MKKKLVSLMLITAMSISLLAGCGNTASPAGETEGSGQTDEEQSQDQTETAADKETDEAADPAQEQAEENETDGFGEAENAQDEEEKDVAVLEDGTYSAKFETDSTMFHVNEAHDERGILTVENGEMIIHIALPSKNVLNLFLGKVEDAQKEGAELLQPTIDEVTYSDGTIEEVHGFDIPVPHLDEKFDVALIGTKGKWYDHEVTVSDPKPIEEDEDEAAAYHVAELIDAIYVQKWTEETDSLCQEAKAAWDALTDAQKELVEGEEADPDYFGRDTGDASLDDPLNDDGIGEKEILVVSFGTSFNDSRAKDIGGIEKNITGAFPEYSVRRAFTSQIIINHIYARDGEKIDNVEQALERAVNNGVKELVVQPTHLMHGAEYDELVETLDKYKDKIQTVKIAEPLLGEVGKDAGVINKDKEEVAKAVTEAAVKSAGFGDAKKAAEDGTAFVFLGHGTSHTANVTYSQMQTQMDSLGYENVFIGTVEGLPEETEINAVIEKVKEAGYKKVVLRPLMVVAGDHANNDMAGDDDDSWKSAFEAYGAFDGVDCQIEGLGRIEEVQLLYVSHIESAISQ